MLKKFVLIYFFSITLKFSKSENCIDKSCILCPKDKNICEKCKDKYEIHFGKCGIECNSIKNCDLCDSESKYCVKCEENCKKDDGECDCSERTRLYVIITILSFIFLSIIIYCILCNVYSKKTFQIEITQPNITNTNSNIKEQNQDDILISFLKNRIQVDEDIADKKCMVCKTSQCKLKYDCGCYVCFECDKKTLKNNKCLSCGKNFLKSQKITCSICLDNKFEIASLNCKCKMVLCKDCFLKFRANNNICTNCKEKLT